MPLDMGVSHRVREDIVTRVFWDHISPIFHPGATPETSNYRPTHSLAPSLDMWAETLIVIKVSGAWADGDNESIATVIARHGKYRYFPWRSRSRGRKDPGNYPANPIRFWLAGSRGWSPSYANNRPLKGKKTARGWIRVLLTMACTGDSQLVCQQCARYTGGNLTRQASSLGYIPQRSNNHQYNSEQTEHFAMLLYHFPHVISVTTQIFPDHSQLGVRSSRLSIMVLRYHLSGQDASLQRCIPKW